MAQTLADLEMLSTCEFAVVTYSSNFGRRVYELMHNHHVDAPDRVVSLDNGYFIWSHLGRSYKIASKPLKNDLALEVGDTVQLVHRRPPYTISSRRVEVIKKNSSSIWIAEFKLDEEFKSIDTPTYNQDG